MIATSRQTRDDYVSRGFRTDRIDVVYNGIDLREWQANGDPARTRERFGVPVGAFLLAFAGRLHPGKGVDVLLDAMQRLPERVHLVIAGQHHEDGSRRDYKAELVMHAGQRAVSERVRFVGHLADPRDLFAAADLTILPSVISEAFGRTVIESMACGTPAVASRVGGIPEILAGNWASMLVPPGDGAALAQRIMTLMDWRSRDPELAARCRAHVEQRFDVRGMVNGVEASLARAIDDWTAGLAVPAATAALR
jgi:glycosyltransferase involved in cell wall biosynthesis